MGQLAGNYNAHMRVRGCSPFRTGVRSYRVRSSAGQSVTEFLEFLSGRLAVLLDGSLGAAPGHKLLVVTCSRGNTAHLEGGALAVSVPRWGSGATDRPTAKAVWIIDLPEDNGPTHLMHQRPGFACSCDDLKTSGAVNKTFTAKLAASYAPPKYGAARWGTEVIREPALRVLGTSFSY
jgi:hypothetical protein